MACRLAVLVLVCARLAAASADFPSEEEPDTSALLQAAPEKHQTSCPTRQLIIGAEVDDETYIQWNGALMASGADRFEFLNLTNTDGDEPLQFANNVDFVKHGRPVFGIVLVRLLGVKPLKESDAKKLKAYIDAGGMLVVGEPDRKQVNHLMKDLGSTIRQKEIGSSKGDFPCSTPEEAHYKPAKSGGCLVVGVTGLQGSNLQKVIDDFHTSNPLFVLQEQKDLVVARAEIRRSLVVVGDDEPFDDDCATRDDNNRFAFGKTTNLRFFVNLFNKRCQNWK